MWLVGDWLLAGESAGYLPRGKLKEACKLFGIAYDTALQAARVCKAFESCVRTQQLSFAHHARIANREDCEQLKEWSIETGATVADLKAEMKRRDVVVFESPTSSSDSLERIVQSGQKFGTIYADPPIDVFFDGKEYWLGDGFHRYHAALRKNVEEITANIHIGDRRQAILFSVGANADHGLNRTNADKRIAVMTLLDDTEWREWSSRKIAEVCCVGRTLVNTIREKVTVTATFSEPEAVKYTTSTGKTALMPVKAKEPKPNPVEPTREQEKAAAKRHLFRTKEASQVHDQHGHNRYRIWKDKYQGNEDREPSIVELKFKTREEVKEWIFRNQLSRRNLTDSQRAVVTLRLKPVLEKKAEANHKANGGDRKSGKSAPSILTEPIKPIDVREELAKVSGLSTGTLSKVAAVLEKGTEEVKAAMLSPKADPAHISISSSLRATTKLARRSARSVTKNYSSATTPPSPNAARLNLAALFGTRIAL